MTINWASIKTSVANAIGAELAAQQSAAIAQWPVPGIALTATYTWNGSSIVTTSDTSEVAVSPPSFIRLDSDNNWYKVISIDPNVSVTVEDTYGIGGFPSGASQSSKASSAVPSPPSTGSMTEKLGTPIAVAVMDGVKAALDQAVINDVADDPGNTVGPGVIV
jgi:type II secretory pathway pseudopilin PulG